MRTHWRLGETDSCSVYAKLERQRHGAALCFHSGKTTKQNKQSFNKKNPNNYIKERNLHYTCITTYMPLLCIYNWTERNRLLRHHDPDKPVALTKSLTLWIIHSSMYQEHLIRFWLMHKLNSPLWWQFTSMVTASLPICADSDTDTMESGTWQLWHATGPILAHIQYRGCFCMGFLSQSTLGNVLWWPGY